MYHKLGEQICSMCNRHIINIQNLKELLQINLEKTNRKKKKDAKKQFTEDETQSDNNYERPSYLT